METPNHFMQALTQLSQSLSTNPLFSTIFTFYALTLLYFPSFFLRLFLSPVPIITAVLLLTLLRLGSSPHNSNRVVTLSERENCVNKNENPTNADSVSEKEPVLEPDSKWVIGQVENGSFPDHSKEEFNRVILQPEIQNSGESHSGSEKDAVLEDYFKWDIAEKQYYQFRGSENEDPNSVMVRPACLESDIGPRKGSVLGNDSMWALAGRVDESGTEVGFVGWDVKAPLQVIYEEYEGQEEEDPVKDPDRKDKLEGGPYRYPPMSFSDADSDSGSSSDGESSESGEWGRPERFRFGFESDSDPDPVDGDGLIELKLDVETENLGFHLEEENLIEIDIFSQTRKCEFVGEKIGVM